VTYNRLPQPPGQGGIIEGVPTMHGNINEQPKPDKPVEQKKRRTITLTNRAPIEIVEDEWPVIAEGACGCPDNGQPWGWDISIHVRRSKYARVVVYGSFRSWDESDDDNDQRIRVGRLLTYSPDESVVWQAVLDVGEDLRSRIAHEPLRKHVVYATDACFAKLPSNMVA